jgi:hypothetical protein
MTDDAEAREAEATAAGAGDACQPANGDLRERAYVADDGAGRERVADPGAVITEEVAEVRADGEPAGYPAPGTPLGPGGVHARPAGEPHPGTVPAEVIPADDAAAEAAAGGGTAGHPGQLHQRWAAIQAAFVDDPRGSVAAAAELVTEAVGTLVASVKERERGLRGEWDRGGVDTEGLRNALRSYRRFLDQLAVR